MTLIKMSLVACVLVCLTGCYEPPSHSGNSAHQAALQADAARREAAWAEAEQRKADESVRLETAWAEAAQRSAEKAERENRAWLEWEQHRREETARKDNAWLLSEQHREEEIARREIAWAESDAQREKSMELTERWEVLLTKQEKQAERFDAVLDRLESSLKAKN